MRGGYAGHPSAKLGSHGRFVKGMHVRTQGVVRTRAQGGVHVRTQVVVCMRAQGGLCVRAQLRASCTCSAIKVWYTCSAIKVWCTCRAIDDAQGNQGVVCQDGL